VFLRRSASDEAISAASDLSGLLHPPRRIRNDSSSCFIRSGYPETVKVKEAQRLGAGPYVQKTYLIERIGQAVKHELEDLQNPENVNLAG
jgi:hypothetical protein